MKIYLELEVDLIPDEVANSEHAIELINIMQKWIPENISLSFIKDEPIKVFLMNVHLMGIKNKEEKNVSE